MMSSWAALRGGWRIRAYRRRRCRENPDQSRSVGELGERLHLDSGTLTPLLKRLASAGYVTRSRDVGDERRVLVTLTAQGLALRDRLAAVPE